MSECSSCHAPIRWAISPSGKRTPVDAEPDREKGNVLLLKSAAFGAAGGNPGTLLAVVLSGDALAEARSTPVPLFLNHWATCPDKAAWREKQAAKRASS